MTTSQAFSEFLENIKVDNSETISNRYHEITKKLNKNTQVLKVYPTWICYI